MPDTHDEAPTLPSGDGKLLVVGIGASAGGIAALKEFFSHVQPPTGTAFVVILHLSPDHDSRLAEVLQVATTMPVMQATQRVRIQADHVYVVPPNRSLAIADGTLIVSEVTRPEQRHSPVDLFFRTLADAHGARAVCVVLSGTGSNGSGGLKRIKEYGGLVIAQDPTEAQYKDMPDHAIATGLVDIVLPIADMPARIRAYRDSLRVLDDQPEKPAGPGDEAVPMREILTLLKVRSGHDFSNYKPATLQRRVQRRMNVAGAASLEQYARAIRDRPDEALTLMKDLLISVTHFFRDPETFAILEARDIPRMFEHKSPEDQVRVWVPGCATGEEAYSLAMLLCERIEGQIDQPSIQVFATDLDEDAIATAREGLYSDVEIADVPEPRLQRFFQREPGGYRVRRSLREVMLFAHHNVIKDPPFSHLDFISCRNLLIYFNRTAQQRVIETFHFALRPGGYLLLGPSESPEGASDLFLTVDRAIHLYESRAATSRLVLPDSARPAVPRSFTRISDWHPAERFAPLDVHHRLLEEYAPPSLVVTEEHSVVHMSGRAGRFLQLSAGEPSRDLLKLVRPELRAPLRTALYQAAKERASVEVKDLPVTLDAAARRVNLTVRPVLREDDPARGFFMVLFDDHDGTPRHEAPHVDVDVAAAAEPLARQLEDELSRLNAQLRTTIEQYEAQVEEAQASAEEQQATNEELRSSAEELETSKEELQSVNEELTTVNQELKIKIDELRLSNNDFQNLIISSDIATLFLDRTFRIKLTTPRARGIFNLLRTDVGRPLSDITSRLVYDGLESDMRLALDQLQTIDREVQAVDHRWYLMRVRPYRTTDDRIEGVVLTFQDVTDQRRVELEGRRSQERLRLLVDGATDYAIFTMTEAGEIDSWNAGAQRMFGYPADEALGHHVEMLFTPGDRAAGIPAAELVRARRDGRALDERNQVRRDGGLVYCSGVTTRLGNGAGLGFAKIARDLANQQRAADAVRDAHASVEQRVADRTRELRQEVQEHQGAELHVVNLLRKLVTTQEDERGRIARNLHDQLGQRLTALRLSLERVEDRVRRELGGDDNMASAIAEMQAIDAEVGFLASELRPAVLDHLGLVAALPKYAREWADHYGVDMDYRGEMADGGRLTQEAEIAFYRVAQEALTNVAKHAHAGRVDMMLEKQDGSIVLVIEDDGVGFDPEAADVKERGVGLMGMKERAALIGASFEIESSSGKGTSIFLRYPVAEHRQQAEP